MDIYTMKPGTYYIGDPSYIVKGEEGYQWIEKLWQQFYQINKKTLLIEIDGITLLIAQTYGGDGVYDGFYVDSGTIAILLIDGLNNDPRFNFRNYTIKGTKFIKFDYEFTVIYDNGRFKIGEELIINTQF